MCKYHAGIFIPQLSHGSVYHLDSFTLTSTGTLKMGFTPSIMRNPPPRFMKMIDSKLSVKNHPNSSVILFAGDCPLSIYNTDSQSNLVKISSLETHINVLREMNGAGMKNIMEEYLSCIGDPKFLVIGENVEFVVKTTNLIKLNFDPVKDQAIIVQSTYAGI